MKRYSECTTRMSTHGGKVYEFTRNIDYFTDYPTWVEVKARVWTGHTWMLLHRWGGEQS